MQKTIYGKVYDTEESVLLARGTFIDGHTSDGRVRNGTKELYRSNKGQFFLSHTTQWDSKRNYMESVSIDGAKKLYAALSEQILPFTEAFADQQAPVI